MVPSKERADKSEFLRNRLWYISDQRVDDRLARKAVEKMTVQLISKLDLSTFDRTVIIRQAYDFLCNQGGVLSNTKKFLLTLLDGGLAIIEQTLPFQQRMIGLLRSELAEMDEEEKNEDKIYVKTTESMIDTLSTGTFMEIYSILSKHDRDYKAWRRKPTSIEVAFVDGQIRNPFIKNPFQLEQDLMVMLGIDDELDQPIALHSEHGMHHQKSDASLSDIAQWVRIIDRYLTQ